MHEIRVFFIVNQIPFHAADQLDSGTFCRLACLRQRLNNAVIRYGDRLMPPLGGSVTSAVGEEIPSIAESEVCR